MMHVLAILLFIAVNVESQVEHCTCTMPRGLINTYLNFNRQLFRNIHWEPNLSTKAKEELKNPGKHTTERLVFISGWGFYNRLVSKVETIYTQVSSVLRSQFIRKVFKLRSRAPSMFGCNGALADYNDHQKNLTIGCLYRLTVSGRNPDQNN